MWCNPMGSWNRSCQTNFESQVFSELCRLSGIRRSHTTPYHPQGNGVCECFKCTLLNMLRTLGQGYWKRWYQHMGKVMCSYHNTIPKAMECTPFFLMFGHSSWLPVHCCWTQKNQFPTAHLLNESRNSGISWGGPISWSLNDTRA